MTAETADNVHSPTGDGVAAVDRSLAGPWPRYWARLLDVLILSFALSYPVSWLAYQLFGAAIVESPFFFVIFALMMFPTVLLCEAGIQFALGTTPAKAAAGIGVETTSSDRLSFRQSLLRTLLVYVRGLGCGIPIVSLIAMMSCYLNIRKGGLTSWDRNFHTRVVSKGSNIYRTILVAVMAIGLAVLIRSIQTNQPTDLLSEAEIASEIQKINAPLPMQVDPRTRLERVTLEDNALTYVYRLVDPQGAPSFTPIEERSLTSQQIKSGLIRRYCDDPPVHIQANGYATRYRYVSVEGKVVAEHTVSAASCRPSGS